MPSTACQRICRIRYVTLCSTPPLQVGRPISCKRVISPSNKRNAKQVPDDHGVVWRWPRAERWSQRAGAASIRWKVQRQRFRDLLVRSEKSLAYAERKSAVFSDSDETTSVPSRPAAEVTVAWPLKTGRLQSKPYPQASNNNPGMAIDVPANAQLRP